MKDLNILLNQDSENQREAELKLALDAINNKNLRAEFSEELANFGIRKEIATVKSISSYKKIMYVVAAIFLIGLAVVFVVKNDLNSMELAQQYAMETTIKHPGLTKGNSNEISTSAAIEAYNRGDWKNAILAFEKTDLTSAENTFYLGLSYFKDKQYEKSISLLTNQNLAKSIYTQEINWFLGLAYLLSNDLTNANAIFIKIKSNEWQFDKAQKLLKK